MLLLKVKKIAKNIVYNILSDYYIIIRNPRIEKTKLMLCTPKLLYEEPCYKYYVVDSQILHEFLFPRRQASLIHLIDEGFCIIHFPFAGWARISAIAARL